MNKKTYQQLEFEPYVEHGVAKLRYKQPITKDMFPEEAQDLAEGFIKANEKPETIISITPCIWNSKHDYSRYISDFVSLAVEGDYMMALESLTIMEQMNGPFDESWLLESQLFLKEYVEKPQRKDERKDKILSDIAYFIKAQNNGIDADLLLE